MKLSVLFPDESEHEREVPRDLHLDRGNWRTCWCRGRICSEEGRLVHSCQLPSTCAWLGPSGSQLCNNKHSVELLPHVPHCAGHRGEWKEDKRLEDGWVDKTQARGAELSLTKLESPDSTVTGRKTKGLWCAQSRSCQKREVPCAACGRWD